MNHSALSQAISKINRGESTLLTPEPSLPVMQSEVDDIFASNPSHWEELTTLYSELGGNLINLAASISEMVHREDIISNLGTDREAFLDLAVRSLKDCEHVSSQLATTKELHVGKVGIVANAEEYTDYLRIYTYYETIMTNNLSMINLSAIDLVTMAQSASDRMINSEPKIEEAVFSETENADLNVAIEMVDSETLTLEAEGANND